MDLFLGQLQSVSGVNIRCALLAVPVRIGCPKAVGLLVLLIAELSNVDVVLWRDDVLLGRVDRELKKWAAGIEQLL